MTRLRSSGKIATSAGSAARKKPRQMSSNNLWESSRPAAVSQSLSHDSTELRVPKKVVDPSPADEAIRETIAFSMEVLGLSAARERGRRAGMFTPYQQNSPSEQGLDDSLTTSESDEPEPEKVKKRKNMVVVLSSCSSSG